jgi:hypothetical protein
MCQHDEHLQVGISSGQAVCLGQAACHKRARLSLEEIPAELRAHGTLKHHTPGQKANTRHLHFLLERYAQCRAKSTLCQPVCTCCHFCPLPPWWVVLSWVSAVAAGARCDGSGPVHHIVHGLLSKLHICASEVLIRSMFYLISYQAKVCTLGASLIG